MVIERVVANIDGTVGLEQGRQQPSHIARIRHNHIGGQQRALVVVGGVVDQDDVGQPNALVWGVNLLDALQKKSGKLNFI